MRRTVFFILLFVFSVPTSLRPLTLKRLGCGISKGSGDSFLERETALSKAISSAFSLVLEGILGEDEFLELKSDVLKPMLENYKRYLVGYEVKTEGKTEGGGYYVCVMAMFNRKVIFEDLRSVGILPEKNERIELEIRFSNLFSYKRFEVLRDRVMGLDGVYDFHIKSISFGKGIIVAVVSLKPSDFIEELRSVCETLGIGFSGGDNGTELDFKMQL